MAANPLAADLAARTDQLIKRIERLETLEFGTAAFPTGGGAIICNFKLAVTTSTVSCFFPVGQTFRHIIAIVACARPVLAPGKIGVQFDSALSRYEFYAREEVFAGGAPGSLGTLDTELTALVGTTSMAAAHPSAQSAPGSDTEQNAMMLFAADTDQLGSPVFTQAWQGFSQPEAFDFPAFVKTEEVQQGGGFYNQLPLGGPIASVKFLAGAPGFIAGSRFTVYGL